MGSFPGFEYQNGKHIKMVFPRAFQTYVPRSHCVQSHVYGAVLVSPEGETVVIRGRQSGKWSFPKGHGSNVETPLEACIRELREETGINMRGIKPDDELRFKSGTYFVFYVKERLPLKPEDIKEVMESMWVPLLRLSFLPGNKDLNSFCRWINTEKLLFQSRANVVDDLYG
jgi:ADP-ribose pyrophosphatase YjhB (NUDIX family)